MEYLNKVLGVQVEYNNYVFNHIPNFINTRYEIKKVAIDNQSAFFLYPKVELEQIAAVKKHIVRVQKIESLPVVLILEHMTYRQKEYLIREKIPFIVEGKQIYLPFMAIYLQERCDAEIIEREDMLPSAQLLLLYFIYHGVGEMTTSQAARDLKLTPTSVSRASNQLEKIGLIKTKKTGVQKIIFSKKTPKELYEDAKEFLLNPVKRCVYVPMDEITNNVLKSGYLALADYTMLNTPSIAMYAADSISKWNKVATNRLQNAELQAGVQLWRYDPRKLSDDHTVDRLSLALALRDDTDERIEEAVDGMLDKLWEEIDGNRDYCS